MAQRLRTPLQFAEHLNRAFEAGLCTGQKPVTADIVEATLSPDFDDLEPRRQGYSVKVLADQFHARPLENARRPEAPSAAGGARKTGKMLERPPKPTPKRRRTPANKCTS